MESLEEEQDTLTTNMLRKRSFQTMMNDSFLNITPHPLDVFKVAMQQKNVAYLDTGGDGKTMIIKDIAVNHKKQPPPCQNQLIIFLAPTCGLVEQLLTNQFSAVRESTALMVEYYHETKMGTKDGKNGKKWDSAIWEHETNRNQVMVMTPQILLDALRNGYIKFEIIWLLVIDECHRASGNHPYASIMKEFYLKAVNKPKVFGITECAVAEQGVSSSREREAQVTTLESVQDSKAYTIQNRTDAKNVTPSPSHNYCFYQPAKVDHAELKVKLESLKLKFGVQLREMKISMGSNYKDTDEKHEILRTRLSNEYANIIYCIDELGLLCAYDALNILIANATKSVEECDIFQQSWSKYVCFLVEVLSIVGKYLPNGHENVLDAGCDYENMVAAGYISPKLNQLFHLFQSFREATKVPCLIFVEKVITAQVLEIIVKRVADLSHFKVSCLSGNSTSVDVMSPKLKKKTLDLFRK
ncbi:endoribonuclease Dicer homolog 3a isoform X1, partial [Tanacetum coccineum]